MFKRTAFFDLRINLYEAKTGALAWSGKSAYSQDEDVLYRDIPFTRTLVFPELNAQVTDSLSPRLADVIILLGSACGLIYFLYR